MLAAKRQEHEPGYLHVSGRDSSLPHFMQGHCMLSESEHVGYLMVLSAAAFPNLELQLPLVMLQPHFREVKAE